jgi:hypothetical protein
MNLLVTFLAVVALCQAGVVTVSIIIERMTSPFFSMTAFFLLFFGVIWVAWRISLWLTTPRAAA